MSAIAHKPAFVVAVPGQHPVQLIQLSETGFAVRYGRGYSGRLPYPAAAKEFGECVFHALACAGIIENS